MDFLILAEDLILLSRHLLMNKNFEYVLLGKFTSDHIEKEFGKLRQGSGGAYFITVQQVFEKVNISKTRLILSLDQNSNLFQTNDAGHQCDKCSYWLSEEICNLVDDLPTLEGKLSAETKSVLLYIAGYVIRKDEQT